MDSGDPVAEIAEAQGRDIAPAKEQQVKPAKLGVFSRGRVLRLLAALAVLSITAILFTFRHEVGGWGGYSGAFLISLVASATIVLPVPGMLLIFGLGEAGYNPFLIGLAAGAGASLGEITGYMLGYSGQAVFQKSKTYLRLVQWMRRRGMIVIFVLALVPNTVFDLGGAAAGALKFPLWKFLVACFLGKTSRNILVALTGAWGIPWVSDFIEKLF